MVVSNRMMCEVASNSTLGKKFTKHPTQKLLSILTRIILDSSKQNAFVLDPFTENGTTGIDANIFNIRFLGIDKEKQFLDISKKRKIEPKLNAELYRNRIRGLNNKKTA